MDLVQPENHKENHKSSQFKISHSSSSTNNHKRVVSSIAIGSRNRQLPSALPRALPGSLRESREETEDDDEDDNDNEMLEVTPDLHMYMGNHFMSAMINGGNGDGPSDEEQPPARDHTPKPQLKLRKTSNLLTDPNAGDRRDSVSTPNGNKTVLNDEITLPGSSGITITPSISISGIGGSSNSILSGGNGAGCDKQYLCRLCGRTAPSGAALFAHLLYPHYAHLWRTEIPHRANQYLCKQCPYTTTKRQHFVQHVAKVHEDLKRKLSVLGENLEVLDNLNPKNTNTCTDRIISKVAKFKTSDDLSYDDSMTMSAGEYSNVNSPMNDSGHTIDSPNVSLINTSMNNGTKNIASAIVAAAAAAASAATAAAAASAGGHTGVGPTNKGPELNSFGLIPGRFPRGYKPFVKCRLCGKGWKGKDNFFTHLVSTHFKHLWQNEVPKHADMFQCHVGNCQYQSKYRYNFLFHLAGKHKQLKEKLSNDGISLDVLIPIEVDEVDEEMLAGGSPTLLKTQSLTMQQQHFINNEVSMQKFLAATAPPPNSGGGGRTPSHGKYSAANSTVRLICRVCKKISFNHTCHRQHVVSKHFQDFWADKCPDQTGLFHCHHCDYQTPNRSVFVIHLAYTHSELKTKLKESGNNPDFADPDVYGKRKYRRSHYDNTQHLVRSINNPLGGGNTRVDPGATPPGPPNAIGGGRRTPSYGSDDEPPLSEIRPMLPPTTPKLGAGVEMIPLGVGNMPLPSDIEDKQKFVCRLCKTEFSKQKAIVEHLALAHFYQVWEDDRPENGSFYVPADGPFVCPHCPFTSNARATFIAHMVNQHEALKTVMSLQYGDKTIEDLYTVSSSASNEDETYDEGDDDEEVKDCYSKNFVWFLAFAGLNHTPFIYILYFL